MIKVKVFSSIAEVGRRSGMAMGLGWNLDRETKIFTDPYNCRWMFISCHQIQKLMGYNVDTIDFRCLPSSEMKRIAINRTQAKKGRVLFNNETIYDWS